MTQGQPDGPSGRRGPRKCFQLFEKRPISHFLFDLAYSNHLHFSCGFSG
jgi:hypothetical protein